MVTRDDIKKIAKFILTATGTAGLIKAVSVSSKKKKETNNKDREFDKNINHEIEQMFEEDQVQEQIDEMWALYYNGLIN